MTLAGCLVIATFFAAVLFSQRSDLFLGRSIKHGKNDPIKPNEQLVGQSSVLDLSGKTPSSRPIPPRTVALTFDDGPDPLWTPQIQAVLDRHRVPATFFVIGERVLEHPDVVKNLVADGHEIGNHTFTHARLGNLSTWQIKTQIALTQRAVLAATGQKPVVFRPPYSGEPDFFPPDELAAAKLASETGVVTMLTDRVVPDYDPDITVDQIVSTSLPPIGSGAVLTFHDAGGNRAKTVEALDRVLTILEANDYRFVRASDLAGISRVEPASAGDARLAGVLLGTSHAVLTISRILLVIGLAYAALGAVRIVMMLFFAERNRRRREPDVEFLPPISVIVPAYNEEVGIADAVRSLANSDYPELEIIVVNDGSTDRTAQVAMSLGLANVRVISQANGGKPSALNAGLRVARHDIVVMVDGDTIFEPQTVRRLVQPFADPAVGAVAGSPKVGNRSNFITTMQHLEYTISSSLERRMFDQFGAMTCIPGAIGAWRRRAIADVGGVSSATLAEDTDLTMALTRAGWRIAFAPEARAYTEAPTTWRGLYQQRFRWSYGILQAIAKHRHAVVERGAGGRLGRRVIPYVAVYGYGVAVFAPVIDLLAVYGLLSASIRTEALVLWGSLNGLALLSAFYALRLDRERLRDAWILPLQFVIYRQVVYIVAIRSLWSALLGTRLRWNKLHRQGGLAIGAAVIDLRNSAPVIDLRDGEHREPALTGAHDVEAAS